MLLIFFTPPNNKSAMEKLNEMYSKVNSTQEKIMEPPREVKFNNQTWAVGATQIQQGTMSLLQFTYLTVSPKAIIHLEAVTTEEGYEKQKKLFDEVVSHTVFSNDSANLLMQSINPK